MSLLASLRPTSAQLYVGATTSSLS